MSSSSLTRIEVSWELGFSVLFITLFQVSKTVPEIQRILKSKFFVCFFFLNNKLINTLTRDFFLNNMLPTPVGYTILSVIWHALMEVVVLAKSGARRRQYHPQSHFPKWLSKLGSRGRWFFIPLHLYIHSREGFDWFCEDMLILRSNCTYKGVENW